MYNSLSCIPGSTSLQHNLDTDAPLHSAASSATAPAAIWTLNPPLLSDSVLKFDDVQQIQREKTPTDRVPQKNPRFAACSAP